MSAHKLYVALAEAKERIAGLEAQADVLISNNRILTAAVALSDEEIEEKDKRVAELEAADSNQFRCELLEKVAALEKENGKLHSAIDFMVTRRTIEEVHQVFAKAFPEAMVKSPPPEPEVCEWTPNDEHASSFTTSCGIPRAFYAVLHRDRSEDRCHRCKLPIKEISVQPKGGA